MKHAPAYLCNLGEMYQQRQRASSLLIRDHGETAAPIFFIPAAATVCCDNATEFYNLARVYKSRLLYQNR
jgi:hypothetical protein